MIGNAGTRVTRMRLREEPSVGTLAYLIPSTRLEDPLSSTYVALTRYCGEGTDVQQMSSIIPGDGLWENITIGDVLDTVGGRLCYVYE